ncbi:hypothetical protein Tcan_11435 [Toxocara canis]|uniref:Uncharacterized protein n=1 Tax=Toxocara canis TaxID=6265 RepID=A0A0B2VMG7_TOXCA|nr:hypothetical protein Tcan_11435 [Toxocara canis]
MLGNCQRMAARMALHLMLLLAIFSFCTPQLSKRAFIYRLNRPRTLKYYASLASNPNVPFDAAEEFTGRHIASKRFTEEQAAVPAKSSP